MTYLVNTKVLLLDHKAIFTLLSAVFNISSSEANLAVLEVVVPDTVSLALWAGILSESVLGRGRVLSGVVGGAGLLRFLSSLPTYANKHF